MARFTTAGGSGSGAPGPQGPAGQAGSNGEDALWNYTGEYNGGASYAVGDLATYDGQLWYRANANGGNVGDTPSEGFIWNLLAAKGTDGTNGSSGLVYLGNYISGNGYVTDLAVVRGSDNNLYIAKANGGLADPVGNTAEWDIFSTNTGGGTANIADFIFTDNGGDSTITLPGDKGMRIEAGSDSDLYLTAGDDLYIQTLGAGDDIHIQAADDIRFTTNNEDFEIAGTVPQWTMNSEGEFHLPGNGFIWNPANSSGDGYGNDTIHLVPNDVDNETQQRIIIDPTAPNHIHIRAGGVQDYSSADLILGGERAGVRVSDTDGTTVVQSKQEDWSWSYTNINDVESTTYRVETSLAEPDYNDFAILNGVKYVINNVVRDEPQGITEYTAIASDSTQLIFYPGWSYTFTRDRGNHAWNFNRAGYLSGPTETGNLRVTGIINDDGDVSVISDTDNVSITSGQDTNLNAGNAVRVTTDGGDHGWDFGSDGKFYGPGEDGALVLGGELVTQDVNMSIKSNGQSVVLNGTLGEFLGSSDNASSQIATIGDITTAVGVGGNGEVTRWTPNFTATGLTFTGSGATHPAYNSYYVKNGRMVSFNIEVNMSTVTNFGTGQYKLQLPFTPQFGFNHFSGWIWADPNVDPDTGTGHTILNADTAGITDVLDLHYLKQSGGANSPIREGLFLQGTPVTLSTISKIYINGTYITAE